MDKNKINLENILKIDAKVNLQLLEYNALVNEFKDASNENILVSLLSSIQESGKEPLLNILECEYKSFDVVDLQNLGNDDAHSKKVFFTLVLNKIFNTKENNSLESIHVFSSLREGLTEREISKHFFNQFFSLYEIIDTIKDNFVNSHKEIKEENDDFERVNNNTCFLSSIASNIKRFHASCGKKLSKRMFEEMTLNEQINLIRQSFSHYYCDSPLLASSMNEKVKHNEEIEDAEIVNNIPNNEDETRKKDNEIAKVVEANNRLFIMLETQIEQNKILTKNLNELSETCENLNNNFNTYLEQQSKISSYLIKKHNIDLSVE